MTDEDIKKLAILLKGSDSDSFSTFTNGLRSNWVFLIAIVGIAMWIFNNFSVQTTTNLQQDSKIDTLTTNIAQLTVTVAAIANEVEVDNDNQGKIQQDIALIKADISTIKEKIQ